MWVTSSHFLALSLLSFQGEDELEWNIRGILWSATKSRIQFTGTIDRRLFIHQDIQPKSIVQFN